MPLSERAKQAAAESANRGPLWKGPSDDGPLGGITFSALSRWLSCRERFRISMIEGLRPAEQFSHRLFYGNCWHICEEHYARGNDPTMGNRADRALPLWEAALIDYAKAECRRFPLKQAEIDHWYSVCRVQFPLYVRYWERHPDVTNRTPLLDEQVFSVPYLLPSGRTIRLRGKWDSVDLVGKGRNAGIFLMENKTKGEIDEEQIKRQLTWDLQTMLYVVALQRNATSYSTDAGFFGTCPDSKGKVRVYGGDYPFKGVRYNVVKRPLSGGKGTITRHKATKGSKCPKCKGSGKDDWGKGSGFGECPKCGGVGRVNAKPEESRDSFYKRVSDTIEGSPQEFFMRFSVEVSPADIERFRRECLDPVLEQLCDWYEWVTTHPDPWGKTSGKMKPEVEMLYRNLGNYSHFRFPHGVMNPTAEGFESDLDHYLESGSTVGMRRVDRLFTELE